MNSTSRENACLEISGIPTEVGDTDIERKIAADFGCNRHSC